LVGVDDDVLLAILWIYQRKTVYLHTGYRRLGRFFWDLVR
jgi:hypothetical protein